MVQTGEAVLAFKSRSHASVLPSLRFNRPGISRSYATCTSISLAAQNPRFAGSSAFQNIGNSVNCRIIAPGKRLASSTPAGLKA